MIFFPIIIILFLLVSRDISSFGGFDWLLNAKGSCDCKKASIVDKLYSMV